MTIAVADQSCVTFMPPPADLASLYNLDYSLYRKVVAQGNFIIYFSFNFIL